MIRIIITTTTLLLVPSSNIATAQTTQRTFQDPMGRNTGRSVTEPRGSTTYELDGSQHWPFVHQRQHHDDLRRERSPCRHNQPIGQMTMMTRDWYERERAGRLRRVEEAVARVQ